jgi:hypothetical protein
MKKGMIFSIDSLVAFVILLIALMGFVFMLDSYERRVVESAKFFYLEEKTIMAADSFVKNYSNKNALFGSAIFSPDKKRILNNELNNQNNFLEYSEKNGFFVKRVSVGKKVLFENQTESKNCVTVKRFVLFESQKNIVEYTGCLVD